MRKYLVIIKNCPLFSGIKEGDMIKMLSCLGAKVIEFDKRYTVFPEGSAAKYIGIVLSGAVQVEQIDYYGNRSIIAVAGRGEVFGEAFACAELNSIPASVIAREPSEVMLINADHIMNTCSNNCGFHRQLIFNLMKGLAVKNILFHQKIEITSKRTTREKLMAYLLLYAKRVNKNRFKIPFDRQALADYLEVDRSGLSAEIGKLRKEGIIESHKNYFELL